MGQMCPRESGSSALPRIDERPRALGPVLDGQLEAADRLAQVAGAVRGAGAAGRESVLSMARSSPRDTPLRHPHYYASRSSVQCMDTTQLLKGVLDLTVLAVVDDEDGYGYDIVRRLRDRRARRRRRRLGLRHPAPALRGRRADVVRRRQRDRAAPQVLRHHARRASQLKQQRDDWSSFSTTVTGILEGVRLMNTIRRPRTRGPGSFVAAVRERLADLTDEEREELVGGLEADLSDLVDERGVEALGDPGDVRRASCARCRLRRPRLPTGVARAAVRALGSTAASTPRRARGTRCVADLPRRPLGAGAGAPARLVGAARLGRRCSWSTCCGATGRYSFGLSRSRRCWAGAASLLVVAVAGQRPDRARPAVAGRARGVARGPAAAARR